MKSKNNKQKGTKQELLFAVAALIMAFLLVLFAVQNHNLEQENNALEEEIKVYESSGSICYIPTLKIKAEFEPVKPNGTYRRVGGIYD